MRRLRAASSAWVSVAIAPDDGLLVGDEAGDPFLEQSEMNEHGEPLA